MRSVTGLARFYHRSPDQIGDDEIKNYLLHLLRVKKLAAPYHSGSSPAAGGIIC